MTEDRQLCGSWRKSTRSGSQSNCVEVAAEVNSVLLRDSKNPGGPRVTAGWRGWRTFVSQAKAGRFDLP
jgi:hypothetical protein